MNKWLGALLLLVLMFQDMRINELYSKIEHYERYAPSPIENEKEINKINMELRVLEDDFINHAHDYKTRKAFYASKLN